VRNSELKSAFGIQHPALFFHPCLPVYPPLGGQAGLPPEEEESGRIPGIDPGTVRVARLNEEIMQVSRIPGQLDRIPRKE